MKKFLYFLTSFIGICLTQPHTLSGENQQPLDFVSLSATTTWREYPLNIPQINFHKEKWVWTCSLTFKSKMPVKLDSLILQWKGEQVYQLSASLFLKRERDGAVIPIQQNFVCDGLWNSKNQQLIFSPHEKVVAVNKYYLMVSFPKNMEHKIKRGQFIVLGTQLTPIMQTAQSLNP